jgi:hypothetical protein
MKSMSRDVLISRRSHVLGCVTVVIAVLAYSAVPALAFGQVEVLQTVPAQGTVEIKYSNGRTEVSAPLWLGNIPSRVRAVAVSSYSSCYELKFPIQALRPYAEIINARSSLDIDLELWTANGLKMGTEYVYSSTWNPLGGQTMIAWTECDVWDKPGSYNLIVKTKQTLSTTGLLSSYVSGTQVIPFVVDPPATKASTVECKKGKQIKSFKRAKCPAGWKATS